MKALRNKEGGSLGEVVSRLLAEAPKTRRVSTERPELEWDSKPMHARLDLDDTHDRDFPRFPFLKVVDPIV